MLPCRVNSPFALDPAHPLMSMWQAFNPSFDPKHPGMVFPLPGPGMFAAMMMKLMYVIAVTPRARAKAPKALVLMMRRWVCS